MKRVFNFSAGPAVLPEQVLRKAAEEMMDYQGSGVSIMEMSHRTKLFEKLMEDTTSLFRKIMGIPANYSVLFLQGGASTQFAMVPLNLMNQNKKADYINSGYWAKKAISEAKKYGTVTMTASSEDKNFSYIPEVKTVSLDADYVHITTNNTIFGTSYKTFPKTGNVPLVADMSSNIMSEKIDVSQFGLIYAGAQKNIGPAGVTVVIIRDDLIGKHQSITPTMLQYSIHKEEKSMYNTPPCWNVYIMKLVLEWVVSIGGIDVVEKQNKEKAALIYDTIDASKIYKGTVEKKDRSLMNIPFVCPTEEMNNQFIAAADKEGLVQLKGHRSVGGMRASVYNAMPIEGVKKLVDFMKQFEKQNT